MTSGRFQPERHRQYLHMLARCGLRSRGVDGHKLDPSDLVQDTLLRATEALQEFRGTTDEEFAAWLRAILAHRLADAARWLHRQKRNANLESAFVEALDSSMRQCVQLAAAGPSPSAHVQHLQQAEHLARALDSLPADQREAIELHHLLGHTVSEAAALMNRSRAGVAGLLRRGLTTMRANMDGDRTGGE